MSTLRGIAVGVLGLAALDVAVSTDQAASRLGGLATGAAGLLRAFIDPSVPAIRDRSGCLDGGGAGGHGKKSSTGDELRGAVHKGLTDAFTPSVLGAPIPGVPKLPGATTVVSAGVGALESLIP